MDLLGVCYVTSDGHYLQVSQGYPLFPGPPQSFQYVHTPSDDKGTTTVEGKEAYWWLGRILGGFQQASQNPNSFWQPGPLSLAWDLDATVPRPPGAFVQFPGGQPIPPPTVYLSYELASDSISLDQLVVIGNSVQPYTPDSGTSP